MSMSPTGRSFGDDRGRGDRPPLWAFHHLSGTTNYGDMFAWAAADWEKWKLAVYKATGNKPVEQYDQWYLWCCWFNFITQAKTAEDKARVLPAFLDPARREPGREYPASSCPFLS